VGVSAKWRIAAFAWGFAEATLFFTVPDVLLTLAAILIGWRRALRLLLLALVGALVGGTAMYGFAAHDFETARITVDSVPLISAEMIERGGVEMRGEWLWNMIVGAMTGTPYKVYAINAPGAGLSLWAFLAGSVLARTVRWVLTLAFAALVFRALEKMGHSQIAIWLWAALWLAFYAFYYVFMSL